MCFACGSGGGELVEANLLVVEFRRDSNSSCVYTLLVEFWGGANHPIVVVYFAYSTFFPKEPSVEGTGELFQNQQNLGCHFVRVRLGRGRLEPKRRAFSESNKLGVICAEFDPPEARMDSKRRAFPKYKKVGVSFRKKSIC